MHEQERFASIDAGEFDKKEHQITLILKDKTILPVGYNWEEMGREFSHEGMFYDIVSLIKTEAGWELVAAADKEEAEIVAKQSNTLHGDKEIGADQKSNKQKTSLKFSLYDQFVECQYRMLFLQSKQLIYMTYEDRLTNHFLGQIHLPPKAV